MAKTDYEREIEHEIEHDAAPHKKRKAGGNARGKTSHRRMDQHARRQMGGVNPGMPMAPGMRAMPLRPGVGGVPAGMPASMPGAVMPNRVMPRQIAAAAPAVLGAGTTSRGFQAGGRAAGEYTSAKRRAEASRQKYPTKYMSPLGDEDTTSLDRSRGDFTPEMKVPRDDYKDGGSADKWIQGTGVDKPGHKGRLHRALGVPEGEKIPAGKLSKALNSSNSHLRDMAQFAKNVK